MSKDKYEGYITIVQKDGIFEFYLDDLQNNAMDLRTGITIKGKMVADFDSGVIKISGDKVLVEGKPLPQPRPNFCNIYKVNYVVHFGS